MSGLGDTTAGRGDANSTRELGPLETAHCCWLVSRLARVSCLKREYFIIPADLKLGWFCRYKCCHNVASSPRQRPGTPALKPVQLITPSILMSACSRGLLQHSGCSNMDNRNHFVSKSTTGLLIERCDCHYFISYLLQILFSQG